MTRTKWLLSIATTCACDNNLRHSIKFLAPLLRSWHFPILGFTWAFKARVLQKSKKFWKIKFSFKKRVNGYFRFSSIWGWTFLAILVSIEWLPYSISEFHAWKMENMQSYAWGDNTWNRSHPWVHCYGKRWFFQVCDLSKYNSFNYFSPYMSHLKWHI